MKLAKTALLFVTYSTITALFAVSTVQVGVRLTGELNAFSANLIRK